MDNFAIFIPIIVLFVHLCMLFVFFIKTLVVLSEFDGCSLGFAACLVKYCKDETRNIKISKEVPWSSTSSCCLKFMEEGCRQKLES